MFGNDPRAKGYRHNMPSWPVRFLAAAIVYWLLAPFIFFGAALTWHILESVAFGLIVASIPTLRRRRHTANTS